MTRPELTLYIDGNCPLCVAEWNRLRQWDRHARLGFVDIAQPGFDPAPLGVELADLNRQLHGWTASGERVVGIDSFIVAYTLVGRGWMVAPLRITAMRPAFKALYRGFARNRMRISRWLGVRAVAECADGTCAVKTDPFR